MSNKEILHKIGEMASIPKDVTQGFPYMSILGNSEIYIENYRGILEYTREVIRIQTKQGRIEISGNKLHIDYYSNDEMKIRGIVKEVKLVNPVCPMV